jgi:SAM-dependent methyltransferase
LTGRRLARRAVDRAGAAGRRLGLLAYRPEQRSVQEWTSAYEAGRLDYYGQLDELGRYSVLVGYVGWLAAARPVGPRVLDVGCGNGLLRERLDGASFSEYVGVDLSGAAVAAARARDHDRSRFVVGDVGSLDEGRFDVVVLNEVLYYSPDPRAFLERLASLLTPDGLLLVSMWRHPGDRALWRTVDGALRLVDRVEVRNRGNRVNPRGWRVACYRSGAPAGPVAPSAQRGEAERALGGQGGDAGERLTGGGAVERRRSQGTFDAVVKEHHVALLQPGEAGHDVVGPDAGLPVTGVDRPEPRS